MLCSNGKIFQTQQTCNHAEECFPYFFTHHPRRFCKNEYVICVGSYCGRNSHQVLRCDVQRRVEMTTRWGLKTKSYYLLELTVITADTIIENESHIPAPGLVLYQPCKPGTYRRDRDRTRDVHIDGRYDARASLVGIVAVIAKAESIIFLVLWRISNNRRDFPEPRFMTKNTRFACIENWNLRIFLCNEAWADWRPDPNPGCVGSFGILCFNLINVDRKFINTQTPWKPIQYSNPGQSSSFARKGILACMDLISQLEGWTSILRHSTGRVENLEKVVSALQDSVDFLDSKLDRKKNQVRSKTIIPFLWKILRNHR